MVRRVLFAGLLIGPLTIALHYLADLDETVEFVLAAIALIPLAWLIGEATEHAAEHTGPGIGGFLNATFGNAPELIIALLAVNEGLTEVVRGSLTGSVVGNLLLVLGFSLVAGPRGELDRWSSFMSFGAIALAILLFLIPAIPSWDGNPDRDLIVDLSLRLDRAPRRLRPLDVLLAPTAPQAAPLDRRGDRGLEPPCGAGRPRRGHSRHRTRRRGARRLARGFRRQRRAQRVLRRRGHRRDRRQRRRARRRRRRRLPRQGQARRGDRPHRPPQVAVFLIPAVALSHG